MVLKLLRTIPPFLTSCLLTTWLCFLMPLIQTWKPSKIVSTNSMIVLVFLLIIGSLPSPSAPTFHNLPEMSFVTILASSLLILKLSISLYPFTSSVARSHLSIEKINNLVSGWKAKVLSQAGHAMLMKSVLSSIPTYRMFLSSFPNPHAIESTPSFKISSRGFQILSITFTPRLGALFACLSLLVASVLGMLLILIKL